jgi:hypothetical protein
MEQQNGHTDEEKEKYMKVLFEDPQNSLCQISTSTDRALKFLTTHVIWFWSDVSILERRKK